MNEKNQVPLLIDSSALLHRSKNTLGMQLSSNDVSTGITFGFLWQIFKLAKTYKTMNFFFCFDSRESKRREIFPEYKCNRKRKEKTQEEKDFDAICYAEFSRVFKIMKKLGFSNTRKIKGLEGDDLIASFVINNPEIMKKSIVVSGDHDLYQILGYCKGMLSLTTGKLYGAANFIIDMGISPNKYKSVMAISGCSGDGVPGIPGVGEKTAIDFLKGNLTSGKKYLDIINEIQRGDKSVILFTERLIELPFKGTPKLRIKKNRLDFDAFIDVCQEYSFNTFLNNPKNFNDWRDLFNGTF